MTAHFEIELEKLNTIIVRIAELAESQVNDAVQTIVSEHKAETKVIKRTEDKIDRLDIKIDEVCQRIFALKQPVASDLRFIMSAMQIGNEIERIGDLAVSIVKKAKSIKDKHHLVNQFPIAELGQQVTLINKKTNECYLTRNQSTIGEIFILNKSIKKKVDDIIHDVISLMKTNSKTVVPGTNLIIVLKHLERISEHCTNIAENVYFIINAKIIKHDKFDDKNKEEEEE